MPPLSRLPLLLFAVPILAHGTAQYPDQLRINSEDVAVFSEPLSQYLDQRPDVRAKLRPYINEYACSASWRGHTAVWEIQNSRLNLLKILANPCEEKPKEVPLNILFPKTDGQVFAAWFTGQLLVPRGKQLKYVHMGYASEYERYLLISVKNGLVVKQEETTKRPQ